MSSPALERKVRQLDNDMQSIYGPLTTISGTQLRQGNRLEEIDQRLDSVERKVDVLDGKVDSVLELLRGGARP